ncbi:glutathione S-transferase family protein [Burkholderia sp. Ac-20379]|uniref:glutathione S-transferase family protein n=1 Tax=Burkholderia sp. Ac-20379 TaxID=2703900 RepID=UPI0019821FA3|nr:glutathione S-transferase family protein [Burkholderia sp. Ac-20379]MBN3725147.1 glutathione S-transferase family protein [Burkholderia sp. Ac-20379]
MSQSTTPGLYYSPMSPFVRKVLVCAAELGIALEHLPRQLSPVLRNAEVAAHNPLGQVPTLTGIALDEALYDSRVICEYLDAPHGKLFPSGDARWRALREQALADGMLNAALMRRYEQVIRPDGGRHAAWDAGQREKVVAALDRFEHWAPGFGARVDIGTISIACALGYLDLRFPEENWRARPALAAWHAPFAQRASMLGTRHPDA